MASLLHDLRYAVRTLLRSPGFTVVTVLTLAVGIGANSALFSVVDSLLLRPLPYPDADRVVTVWSKTPDGSNTNLSAADFLDYREQNRAFEHFGAGNQAEFNVVIDGAADRLTGFEVTSGFLESLGVEPMLGRRFTPDDGRPGAPRVAILSYGTWRTRFGGDPGIIGQPLTVDGVKATVAGVLPAGFRFIFSPELLIPLTIDPAAASRTDHILFGIARIRPGIAFEQARADVQGVAANLARLYPETLKGWSADIVNLREIVVGPANQYRDVLVLFAAVGFVLLIACVNIANLLLVRAASRQRELAVRASLGAVRGRLVRQVLTEGTVLALLGGAAGVLLASWLSGLAAMIVPSLIVDAIRQIGLNARVIGFSVAVSLLTGILFSLPPAWRASRLDITSALKTAGRGPGARTSGKLRSALVIAEVALSLILLTGAGLMTRSLLALYSSDLGLRPENVVTMRITMPAARYSQAAQVRSFDRALLDRVRALPGVRSAGLSLFLPLEGLAFPMPVQVASHPVPVTERRRGSLLYVSDGSFETLGVRLRAGRFFTERDNESAPRVAMVNESFVREQFKNRSPLGERLLMGEPIVGSYNLGPDVSWEIVGVIADMKYPGGRTYSQMYVPAMQWTQAGGALAVRTGMDSPSIVKAVRAAVREIDPNVPVTNIRTMQEIARASISRPKLSAWVLVGFAAVALILAALGIYGVMSYAVAQRTSELGIRLALGARPRDLVRMTLRSGLVMAGTGLVIGLAGALALTRVLESMLYSVTAADPATYAGVSAILLVVALLSAYIPARRAAHVDPVVALRYE